MFSKCPRSESPLFLFALGALISLGGCGADPQAPEAEDPAPRRPSTESIFDTSKHPGLSELGDVVAGLFLPDSGLALLDRTEIHLVDLSSGGTRVVGREGEGPKEFGHITRAIRTPQGIAVWDILRHRATFISPDGKFLRTEGYLDAPFQDFFNAYPVGVRSDGRIVFRDGIFRGLGDYEGRTSNPAKYLSVQGDGQLEIVAQAKGNEKYYHPKRSGNVVFGHRTLEAATEDRLIIAETDRDAMTVLDWGGVEVAQIPIPAGARLSEAELQAGRQSLVSENERFLERMREAIASGRFPARPGASDDFDVDPPYLKDWPMNDVAPPIDVLLTDFDERLWVRDYRLPDQDSVTWRVWDIDQSQLLFTARLSAEDRLLDARGHLALLRRMDAFDVPRAVISRLRAASGEG